MIKTLIKSLFLLIILIILTGFIYPLIITGIAGLAFNHKSSGSLIYINDNIAGSELIGQSFISDKYFHSRPSFAGQNGYDPLKSGGSNYAPTNEEFISIVRDRTDDFKKENHLDISVYIPSDIVTASGSGLDPNISVESALLQAERISLARKIPVGSIRSLILNNSGRQYGFLGEAVVNVLKLNLLLDVIKQ
jgi:potassium-transporting ATPase KdpC subunit